MACYLVLNFFFCLKRVYNSPGCDQLGRLFFCSSTELTAAQCPLLFA